MNIKKLVNNFKTKNPEGFLWSEINELLKNFSKINMGKFYDAMNGNTCMIGKDGIIHYHCDVELAIRCGIENRNFRLGEWD